MSATSFELGPKATFDPDGANSPPARQVAALVWRQTSDLDVLLVTSRTTRRWLLPKGWPIEGRSALEAAVQEAYEEAGVVAMPGYELVGSYQYDKVLKDGSLLPCAVDVFAIQSVHLLDEWPEMSERKRRWYGVETAASLVTEPDLASLLRDFGRTSPVA